MLIVLKQFGPLAKLFKLVNTSKVCQLVVVNLV